MIKYIDKEHNEMPEDFNHDDYYYNNIMQDEGYIICYPIEELGMASNDFININIADLYGLLQEQAAIIEEQDGAICDLYEMIIGG